MRCSRRSVPRRGRKLVERDLQWRSCCLAVRTRGLIQLHDNNSSVLQARGESCSKSLCIWTLKPEQQNAIDHVCAFGEFDHSFWPIYYPEHSHRRTHCADIQQREAPAAGRAPMNEHQFDVEGAERPYVRPRSQPKEHLNTLLFDRATRRNRKDLYEEKRYRGADIDGY